MEFSNSLVGGSDELVREGIQSRGYVPGVSGWRIARDGSAEFSDVSLRGGLLVTNDARSANYSTGVSGWILRNDGTAEFNGTVEMAAGKVTGALESASAGWMLNDDGTADFTGTVSMGAGIVTGSIKSSNYSAQTAGWILKSDGTAEFNGSIVTTLVDGKIHSGSNTDTSRSTVGTSINVTNANPQNTPQIEGHAYRALVQVAVSVTTAGSRISYRLVGDGVQLGVMTPNKKAQATGGTYETFLMMFVWRANSTTIISNINLEMTYQQGTTGNSVWTRVSTNDFAFIIDDLTLADRITNL